MCTLAVISDPNGRWPLVLAANRDEYLERPTLSPRPHPTDSRIFCGIDERAGGTWLGVSSQGIVAAVLNRRTSESLNPSRKSRGALCVDALRKTSASSVESELTIERAAEYNPFHLFVADDRNGWTISSGAGTTELRQKTASGLTVMTNADRTQPCPRRTRVEKSIREVVPSGLATSSESEIVDVLRDVLSEHSSDADGLDGPCIHGGAYGTRSSSIVLRGSDGWRFFHAEGPPCTATFRRLL